MAETLNFQINIGGKEQIVSTFGELKRAIKEAEFEALKLSQQFGEADPRVQELRKQIGQLKDSIQDSAEATQNFAKGAGAFPAISKSIQGIAGGFAAVQGAIGLLGVESKEVEKQLLKVQSALALSQGLESVIQSADAFNNLGAIIKNNVIKAFTGLKAAIGATGIGALAIALTLVIGYFDDIKKVILNLFPSLEKLGKFVGNAVEKFTDFVGITSQAERNLEALEKKTKRGNEAIEARIKILTAQGGKEKEIYQESLKLADNELNALREKLKTKGKLSDEELKQFRDLQVQKKVLQIEEQNRLKKVQEDNEKKRKEAEEKENQRISALDQRANDARIRLINDENNRKKLAKEKEDEENKRRAKADDDAEKNVQSVINRAKVTVAGVMAQNDHLRWQEEQNRKAAEEREKAKQDAILLTGQAFGAVADLVGRETAAGKALASAQALINTYLGITQVLANDTTIPEPFGTIQKVAATATILASGLSALKNINKVQIPSKYGSGGSVSAPSTFAPVAPMGQTAQLTQLNQASINAIGNQAIRAYVVETDISASQKRIEAIKQKAKFG